MKRKGKKDEKSIQEIEKTRNSVEKPDGFSEDITDGLFKDLEHKKVNIRMLNFKSKMQKQQRGNQKQKIMNFQISIKNLTK